MARLVILGHGGFDTGSFETLVPPNTTIKFFADAGSRLMIPAITTGAANASEPHWVEGQNAAFDYAKVADMFVNFSEVDKPVAAGGVVYNMELQAPGAESQRIANELHQQGKWGGDLLMKPDAGSWKLCHGDATTCPTPKLHVANRRHDELVAKGEPAMVAFKQWLTDGASGALPEPIADFGPRLEDVPREYFDYVANGVPEARWRHGCAGILGASCGEGKEIFWLACSGFEVDQAALDAIGLAQGLPTDMTAATDAPGVDWTPNDAILATITTLNGQNVKKTPDGGRAPVIAGGFLVLIGEGHDAQALSYTRRQADREEGSLSVTKGGAFSKGSVDVSGISGKKELVKTAIGEISDKKVNFA